jgi:hypothetical protein
MQLSQFIEPDDHHKAWLLLLFAFILIPVGFFFVSQTQLVVWFYQRPNISRIRESIKLDRALQDGYRSEDDKKWGVPARKISFKMFKPDTQERLERLTNSLLREERLQKELLSIYGTNFEEVYATVVPGWEVSPGNIEQIGLTQVSLAAAESVSGEPSVPGFTVRDQVAIPVRLTTSGTPIVTINIAAFDTDNKLKLTLFHEFHHAMNIDGNPRKYYLFQNDLTFLPHYCDYIKRNNLEGWTQYNIIALIIVSWGTLAYLMYGRGDGSPRGLLIELGGRFKRRFFSRYVGPK